MQQVAFELAKVLTEKWKEDRGDTIPMHRLFPADAGHCRRGSSRARGAGGESAAKQDLAINPYFGKAVAMLFNAMELVDSGGASQEQAGYCAWSGVACGRRGRWTSTPGKPLHEVDEVPPQCGGVRLGLGTAGGGVCWTTTRASSRG